MAEVCYTKTVFMAMLCPERASHDSLGIRCPKRMGMFYRRGWMGFSSVHELKGTT